MPVNFLMSLLHITVRTVFDMVVDEPEEPIFVILQIKQTTSGGIRQSHSDAFVSFSLKCISPLYHNEQSEIYLYSCEVFIHKMLRAIRFFHWTTCQIWSTYRLLKLWD